MDGLAGSQMDDLASKCVDGLAGRQVDDVAAYVWMTG